MRFSRKSPAVGSMERHWPEEDLMVVDVKVLTAVVSTGLASAAAEGFRTRPARETEIAEAGLAEVAATADAEEAEVMTTAGEEVEVDVDAARMGVVASVAPQSLVTV